MVNSRRKKEEEQEEDMVLHSFTLLGTTELGTGINANWADGREGLGVFLERGKSFKMDGNTVCTVSETGTAFHH